MHRKEIVPSVCLNNGNQMPILGYGTYQISDQTLCEKFVYDAIVAGYRMFDTAASYGNEEAVGNAVKRAILDGIVKREELFLITKLWVQDYGKGVTRTATEKSMKRLQTDYLDMYLIHQPYGDYYSAWHELEHLYNEGRIKNIGVCNFTSEKLMDLSLNNKIVPAVNQIEIHPFFHHDKELNAMKDLDIKAQGWGPLSEGQRDIFHIKLIEDIGSEYGKSAAQVILRWHIQKGISVIPRTTQKNHLLDNIDIWDFELSGEDITEMNRLDIGYSEIIDFDSACTAKWLNQWKIHE